LITVTHGTLADLESIERFAFELEHGRVIADLGGHAGGVDLTLIHPSAGGGMLRGL
jgi:thymidine phosphorylase